MITQNKFNETLLHYRTRVDHALKTAIFPLKKNPDLLRETMHYSALNGGKRLRPILVYATGSAFNQTLETLDPIAAAIECIHCYSLIHDDLPAMDNDTLRRNKPTCHIAFGEAMAILAGDALQTLAFDLLTTPQKNINPTMQLKIAHTLAHHSGASGMAAGQSLDILAENKTISAAEVEHIHYLKTGALIKAAVIMGALAAGCDDTNTLHQLDAFATRLGIAFQLQDDLLDVIGNRKSLGKNPGKDNKQHKATYALSLGIDATKERIGIITTEAKAILASIPKDMSFLTMLCDELVQRVS